MSSEDKEVESEIKYAWRPATRADIGSVARFCKGENLLWEYGILCAVLPKSPFQYEGLVHFGLEWFDVCEIQYVADENP